MKTGMIAVSSKGRDRKLFTIQRSSDGAHNLQFLEPPMKKIFSMTFKIESKLKKCKLAARSHL
jgi:hypothetical protein